MHVSGNVCNTGLKQLGIFLKCMEKFEKYLQSLTCCSSTSLFQIFLAYFKNTYFQKRLSMAVSVNVTSCHWKPVNSLLISTLDKTNHMPVIVIFKMSTAIFLATLDVS